MDRKQAGKRSRLIAACTTVVAERGVEDASVAQIIATAELSLADFQGQFADREGCILATYADFLDRLLAVLQRAFCAEDDWAAAVRAAIAAGLGFFADLNGPASTFLVNTLAGDSVLIERRLAFVDSLIEPLRDGRQRYPQAADLPEVTEQFLVAGVVGMVSAHLLAEDLATLAILEGDIVQFVLAPYMDLTEARRLARG